jgi:hypothetical protein
MIKPSKYDVEIRKLETEIEEAKAKLTELKVLRSNKLFPFKDRVMLILMFITLLMILICIFYEVIKW